MRQMQRREGDVSPQGSKLGFKAASSDSCGRLSGQFIPSSVFLSSVGVSSRYASHEHAL